MNKRITSLIGVMVVILAISSCKKDKEVSDEPTSSPVINTPSVTEMVKSTDSPEEISDDVLNSEKSENSASTNNSEGHSVVSQPTNDEYHESTLSMTNGTASCIGVVIADVKTTLDSIVNPLGYAWSVDYTDEDEYISTLAYESIEDDVTHYTILTRGSGYNAYTYSIDWVDSEKSVDCIDSFKSDMQTVFGIDVSKDDTIVKALDSFLGTEDVSTDIAIKNLPDGWDCTLSLEKWGTSSYYIGVNYGFYNLVD